MTGSDAQPVAIPKNATVEQVRDILAEARRTIEKAHKTAKARCEHAANARLGVGVMDWLERLDGLDSKFELSKVFYHRHGWHSCAEGNEQLLIDRLTAEARYLEDHGYPHMVSGLYNANVDHGRRLRWRHDQYTSLVHSHAALTLDGTVNGAIRCCQAFVDTAKKSRVTRRVAMAGTTMIIESELFSATSLPCDALRVVSPLSWR